MQQLCAVLRDDERRVAGLQRHKSPSEVLSSPREQLRQRGARCEGVLGLAGVAAAPERDLHAAGLREADGVMGGVLAPRGRLSSTGGAR